MRVEEIDDKKSEYEELIVELDIYFEKNQCPSRSFLDGLKKFLVVEYRERYIEK